MWTSPFKILLIAFIKWLSSELLLSWMSIAVHPQHQAISESDGMDSEVHSFTGGAVGNKLSVVAGLKDGQEEQLDKRVEPYQG